MRRIGLLLATALLAGCASGGETVTTPGAPGVGAAAPAAASASGTTPDCDPYALGAGRPLTAADHPTAVLRCTRGQERVSGDGEWLVQRQERASEGIEVFAALLRRPSETAEPDQACNLIATIAAIRVELDGRPTVVALPKNACSQALPEVLEAYQALTWTTVERTPLSRTRSESAVLAGCEVWKDMIALVGDQVRAAGPGPVLPGSAPIRICRYSSTEDAGEPEGGTTVTGGQALALRTALAELGPARPCTTPHTRFAVLTAEVYVELDGCLRVLTPRNTLRQGDAALVALLEG